MEISRRKLVALVVGAAGAVVAKSSKAGTPEWPAGTDPMVHSHAESDVTNLVSDLAGKAPLGHGHSGTAAVPGWVDVTTHGAVGDGNTDDTVAIQAAIDAVAALPNGGTVYFPTGRYLVSGAGILMPKYPTPPFPGAAFKLIGHGATLKRTTRGPIIGRPLASEYSPDAILMTGYKFVFEGLHFLGNNTAGQVGLDMNSTYGMIVRDCYAELLDIGFRATYCLMARFESCLSENCTTNNYVARSGAGVFTDGTVLNSGSNHTVFKGCHANMLAGADAGFLVLASSGVVIEDCITEGWNPVYNVRFDTEGSTVDQLFTIRNLHSENTPTGAVIKTTTAYQVIIESLWHQTNCVLVDGSANPAPGTIICRDWPLVPGTPSFNHGGSPTGGLWDFKNVGRAVDLTAAAKWVGGVVPTCAKFEILNQGSIGMKGQQAVVDDLLVQAPVDNARLYVRSKNTSGSEFTAEVSAYGTSHHVGFALGRQDGVTDTLKWTTAISPYDDFLHFMKGAWPGSTGAAVTTDAMALDSAAPSSGNTPMFLTYHNGTSVVIERVTVGAVDSAGPGFKVLRVPN